MSHLASNNRGTPQGSQETYPHLASKYTFVFSYITPNMEANLPRHLFSRIDNYTIQIIRNQDLLCKKQSYSVLRFLLVVEKKSSANLINGAENGCKISQFS